LEGIVVESDLVAIAKGLIATLEEFIDHAEDIGGDYQENLRLQGFLEGVDQHLRGMLDWGDLCDLSDELHNATGGDHVAKEILAGKDPQALLRGLLRLALRGDADAIAYLKERFGIDLTGSLGAAQIGGLGRAK
jgi:hypothetical protein